LSNASTSIDLVVTICRSEEPDLEQIGT